MSVAMFTTIQICYDHDTRIDKTCAALDCVKLQLDTAMRCLEARSTIVEETKQLDSGNAYDDPRLGKPDIKKTHL